MHARARCAPPPTRKTLSGIEFERYTSFSPFCFLRLCPPPLSFRRVASRRVARVPFSTTATRFRMKRTLWFFDTFATVIHASLFTFSRAYFTSRRSSLLPKSFLREFPSILLFIRTHSGINTVVEVRAMTLVANLWVIKYFLEGRRGYF